MNESLGIMNSKESIDRKEKTREILPFEYRINWIALTTPVLCASRKYSDIPVLN